MPIIYIALSLIGLFLFVKYFKYKDEDDFGGVTLLKMFIVIWLFLAGYVFIWFFLDNVAGLF